MDFELVDYIFVNLEPNMVLSRCGRSISFEFCVENRYWRRSGFVFLWMLAPYRHHLGRQVCGFNVRV